MNLAPEYSQATVWSSSFKAVGYECHQAVLLLLGPFHIGVWVLQSPTLEAVCRVSDFSVG